MNSEIVSQRQTQQGEIILYQPDETVRLEVRLEDETVWLTTNQRAAFFDREESNIRRHVINVFKEGELERDNNVHFLHVNGVKKPVPFYIVRTNQPPVEGIFYDGQIFDAYRFVSDLIRKARRSITLIDNYVDDTVLTMLDKRGLVSGSTTVNIQE